MLQALNKSQAIIEFHPDGTIITANENFLDTLGYRLDEIKGHHHSIFVEKNEAASASYQRFWETLRRGEYQAAEYRRIGKSGKEVWIQASYNPVFNHQGKITRIVKFATDITAEKLRNAAYCSQIDAISKSQAVIEFNMDGTIITANKNFLDTLGYSIDEIRGKHHSMFVEKSDVTSDEYKRFWETLRRGEYQSAEYKRIGKSGKQVWIQASYNPVFDSAGQPVKIVKYATDTTASKLKNADYQGQIDAISKSQAVIEFNMDGTIITANKNFLDTLGYSLDEVQGKHHSMFVEKSEATSEEYKRFWETLRRGEYQSAEYKRFGSGGKEVWIQASYNPIFDPSGQPFKVVKYATDITNQIIARQKREEVAKMIDEKLSAIVSGISTANQQAASASSASTQTAATVQTIAAASEEFSASAREIGQNMQGVRESLAKAFEEIGSADNFTQTLSSTTDEMSGIVVLIQNIASQINLLALNATIESARAGEAGKGFAVVASEVKNLANQVAAATNQISDEIVNVQSVSNNVVDGLARIMASITPVQTSVTEVASAVEQQGAATQQIASNMQATTTAVNDIDFSLSEIAKAVEGANEQAVEGIRLYRSSLKAAS